MAVGRAVKGRMGRPTTYTTELATAICDRIATGESLRTICAAEDMPDKATVFRWLAKEGNQALRDQYARAREAQADFLAEEIIEIADETFGDFIEKESGGGGPTVRVVDHEHISRSRLRVDARKWMAGKLAPKKYGERVTNELVGPNDGPIEHKDVSARELVERRIAQLAARAKPGGHPRKPK